MLTDREGMSNLYREPSIDACYQVSVHLAKRFQRRRFKKIGQSEQELPMAAMFVNGSEQNEQSLERTFHRCFLPSFTSFGREFQRRRLKCEKLTDDGRQVMAKAHIAFGKVS